MYNTMVPRGNEKLSVVSCRRQVFDDLSPLLEHLLDFGHRRLKSRNGKLAGASRAKTRVNFTFVILAILINWGRWAMFFAGIFEYSASPYLYLSADLSSPRSELSLSQQTQSVSVFATLPSAAERRVW